MLISVHKYNCFVIITATMLLLLIIITFLFICTSFILFIVHTAFICYAKVFICPFTYSASVYCFRFERASERIEETLAWAHTAHRHGLSFCFYPNYGMLLFIVRDAFLTKNWRSLMKRKKERRNTQKWMLQPFYQWYTHTFVSPLLPFLKRSHVECAQFIQHTILLCAWVWFTI